MIQLNDLPHQIPDDIKIIIQKIIAVNIIQKKTKINFEKKFGINWKDILNYKTKTSLDDGISKMIEYIKNKGVKKFRYHLDIEIINSQTPDTWKKKIF